MNYAGQYLATCADGGRVHVYLRCQDAEADMGQLQSDDDEDQAPANWKLVSSMMYEGCNGKCKYNVLLFTVGSFHSMWCRL